MYDDDSPDLDATHPAGVRDVAAMIAMIDYLIPECRGFSPVTTVLLSLARRELATMDINQDDVVRSMARRA
jgi:hypothetical protein